MYLLKKRSSLGNNGSSSGDTYLYHETNQSYTDGPTLPIHNSYGACTAFTSKSHAYRPVVIYVPSSHSTLYLWDYTMNNNWETCKYTVSTLCNPVVPVGHLLNARQFHSEVNL